ncbi:MAG: ABC transporter ATP-binding protein, partial [Planctomycetes bacterium]|nr:ABC transporter ATP-binding protein [Planctomycetota bacterium]
LNRLKVETFVLDLRRPLAAAPVIDGYGVRLVDATTLEAEVHREQSVNRLFMALEAAGVEVISLRNKSNRLEELFLRMTAEHAAGSST